jgi:hypothetical protein
MKGGSSQDGRLQGTPPAVGAKLAREADTLVFLTLLSVNFAGKPRCNRVLHRIDIREG